MKAILASTLLALLAVLAAAKVHAQVPIPNRPGNKHTNEHEYINSRVTINLL
jgi:hypothetical protein